MTVELIQIGKKDTNNYEQCLQDFGYTDLDKNVKEDVIAVWKFFCNEELVLRGLKKFVTAYFLFNQEEKNLYGSFSMIGEAKIILIPQPLPRLVMNLKPVLIFSIPNIPQFYMVN